MWSIYFVLRTKIYSSLDYHELKPVTSQQGWVNYTFTDYSTPFWLYKTQASLRESAGKKEREGEGRREIENGQGEREIHL